MKNELVHIIQKDVFTNTLIVAENLEVPHRDLLRTVASVIDKTKVQCAGAHIVFIEKTFTNKQGRTYPMYEMNEDAYMLLAMQLSNYEKAFAVQLAIIKAFRSMAIALVNQQNVSWIEARKNGKIERVSETDVIKEFVDYATKQGSQSAKTYYMNITKMTNKALEFIIQDKTGIPVRDLSSMENLGFIMALDKRAGNAIANGMSENMHYKDIYHYAKAEVNKLADVLVFRPNLKKI
ncbi:MAG: Rha family transcriptional regulator [Bacteroidales bacterium]|nr:Rha family transcriptional regulator [Bacteroidales bacterium]